MKAQGSFHEFLLNLRADQIVWELWSDPLPKTEERTVPFSRDPIADTGLSGHFHGYISRHWKRGSSQSRHVGGFLSVSHRLSM